MPDSERTAKVVLRLGSHSEKEYIEKTMRYFDGVMVGANLFEVSPGATASLLFKLTGTSKQPYFIDPMTYAFGSYYDPETYVTRDDLNWIKSDQKVKGGRKGETARQFKSSYSKLATKFGQPFTGALSRSRAVGAEDFPNADSIDSTCRTVLDYQANAVRSVFAQDPETASVASRIPPPGAIFAPYFYIEESEAETWIKLNAQFASSTALARDDCPVHLVVCCHRSVLTSDRLSNMILDYVKASDCAGVWLWFSRLDEHSASRAELAALCSWVSNLSKTKEIYNMHGGYFSLALSKLGLTGIAHGVGYGEQKDVVPIIGQSTPTIQYYVRNTHAKFSIAQITRCFFMLDVKTPAQFFEKICDCVICRGVIGDNLDNFSEFGEIHYSTPSSKRASQTPAAAKRCRFHFLLNRIKERDFVNSSTLMEIAADLERSRLVWSRTIIDKYLSHLDNWRDGLI